MKTLTPGLICLVLVAQTIEAGEAQPAGRSQWVTPPVRTPGLYYRTFYSRAARSEVSYHIYLPEAYTQDEERRFPVLYYLHGSNGGVRGLAFVTGYFNAAIAEGRIPPMLVVFPNGLRLSMWCDSKDGRTPVETVVVKELIPHVDQAFRTIASRVGRAVEGFSMGGYGAARLAFKYPELFCALSMLAPGPLQLKFPEIGPRTTQRKRDRVFAQVYGSDQEYFEQQSPWRLVEKKAEALKRDMLVRMVIGERDEMLSINRSFHLHLKRLGIPHTFIVLPGLGHNPPAVLSALSELGDKNWSFYHEAFGVVSSPEPQG
ncbi:MAG: esterase family protein [Armatimonadetes bacterium]|nr:esterase family protein [Armatimonadota bacterium]